MQGTIVDIIRAYYGKYRVTFEVDSVDEINGLTGLLNIIVKRFTYRRSLNANKYFHLLVGKIADWQHIAKARDKNILLGK